MAKFYSSLLFIGSFLISASLLAQNVGIGVPSPSEKLEVAGNVYAQRLLVKSNSVSTTSDLSFTANAHIETDNSMTFSIDANDVGTADYFGFGMNSASRNGSFDELMRIEEGGNVGIGTVSPSAKLEIAGNLLLQNGTAVNEFSTDGTLGDNSDNSIPTEQAVKTYVDNQFGDNDDWDKSGDDIYNNNTGNVGIGEDTPLQSLEVVGNVVQGNGSNLIIAALESRVPVPSIKKASEVSFTGSNANYPNLVGESDPCSGLVTWAAAKAHAEAQGGRLPTIDEVLSNVAEGSGCGYDSEYVWTQTKCGYNSYFVAPGDNISLSSHPVECRSATATANTRFVAEIDKGNLPAITDSEGALRTDKVKARVGNGIQLVDDDDNIGIALLDGGALRFDNYTNGFLEVDGSGNVSSVSTIPSGSINEDDPTWSGSASTSSDISRTGKVLLSGGSTASSYSNASAALETDHYGDGTVGLQMNGSTSAYRIGIQDGHGRVHHYWNAYDSGSDHRYDVANEGAAWFEMGSTSGIQLRTASGGAAGDIISWNTGIDINSDGQVGIAGGANGSYELHVNGKIGSNGINETSDKRFKKDIQPLENAMDKVRQLNGVSYYWRVDEYPDRKFDEEQDLGVIAQEIEKVLPQVVETDAEGYKSVQYSHIVPLLIEALKEQDDRLMEKESVISAQAKQLEVLNSKVDNIESLLDRAGFSKDLECSTK